MGRQESFDPVSIGGRASQSSLQEPSATNKAVLEHDGSYGFLHVRIKELTERNQVLIVKNEKLRKKNQELQKLVMIDPLTRAYNRLFLAEVAESTVATEMRKNRSWAALFLDIDHFKKVNDDYGHPVGDEVLTNVVETMKKLARKGDFIIRCGGEEFLVLLFNIAEENVQELAERFRKAVKETATDVDDEELYVTVSIGVCFVPADGQTSLESVIIHANDAMRSAKCNGRNQVVFCPEQRKSNSGKMIGHRRRKSD